MPEMGPLGRRGGFRREDGKLGHLWLTVPSGKTVRALLQAAGHKG